MNKSINIIDENKEETAIKVAKEKDYSFAKLLKNKGYKLSKINDFR
ncbi:hypothetical protein ACTPEO_00030 [Clostridioides difficile]